MCAQFLTSKDKINKFLIKVKKVEAISTNFLVGTFFRVWSTVKYVVFFSSCRRRRWQNGSGNPFVSLWSVTF